MSSISSRLIFFGVILVVLSGCVVSRVEPQATGATVGGVFGGLVGATLDHRNPWRGGIVGATVGAITGATLSELSQQASGEVAVSGRPVEYRMESGGGYYYAEPIGYEEGCRKVREKVYENKVLVSTKVLLICREAMPERDEHKHKHKKKHGKGHHDDDDEDDD